MCFSFLDSCCLFVDVFNFLSFLFLELFPKSSVPPIDNVFLKPGHIALFQLSQLLASERWCYHLAASLLQQSPGGGSGFIHRHTTSDVRIDWREMAHSILRNWCTDSQNPEDATSENLLQVLRYKLNAQAAADFLTEYFGYRGDNEVVF